MAQKTFECEGCKAETQMGHAKPHKGRLFCRSCFKGVVNSEVPAPVAHGRATMPAPVPVKTRAEIMSEEIAQMLGAFKPLIDMVETLYDRQTKAMESQAKALHRIADALGTKEKAPKTAKTEKS